MTKIILIRLFLRWKSQNLVILLLKSQGTKKLHLNILKNLNKGCLSIFLGGKKK